MIEVLIEAVKYLAIMLGTSAGLNLILRNKISIPMEKRLIPYLPVTVLMEEALFRLAPFVIIGMFTPNPIIPLAVSSTIFGLVHIGNLKDIPHSLLDTIKYTLNILTLGIILGVMYLQQGFWFTFAIHLIYDFIVAGIMLKFPGGKKDGSTQRV